MYEKDFESNLQTNFPINHWPPSSKAGRNRVIEPPPRSAQSGVSGPPAAGPPGDSDYIVVYLFAWEIIVIKDCLGVSSV